MLGCRLLEIRPKPLNNETLINTETLTLNKMSVSASYLMVPFFPVPIFSRYFREELVRYTN